MPERQSTGLNVMPGLTRHPEEQERAKTLDSRFRGNDDWERVRG